MRRGASGVCRCPRDVNTSVSFGAHTHLARAARRVFHPSIAHDDVGAYLKQEWYFFAPALLSRAALLFLWKPLRETRGGMQSACRVGQLMLRVN